MISLSIWAHFASRGLVSVFGHRLVEHLVDLRVVDAEVGVAAGLADGAAVDDLRQEAETVGPVRTPAVDHQAELLPSR